MLNGSDGNDFIRGRPGDDNVDGGNGNDRLFVGRGLDVENGGDGNDVLHALARDNQVDMLDCGPGQDVVWLNANEHDTHVNCEVVKTVSRRSPTTANSFPSPYPRSPRSPPPEAGFAVLERETLLRGMSRRPPRSM